MSIFFHITLRAVFEYFVVVAVSLLLVFFLLFSRIDLSCSCFVFVVVAFPFVFALSFSTRSWLSLCLLALGATWFSLLVGGFVACLVFSFRRLFRLLGAVFFDCPRGLSLVFRRFVSFGSPLVVFVFQFCFGFI